MPQKLIDQTTIQPDGSPGDDAYTAFATCNDNFQDAEARLVVLEAGGGETGGRLDNEIAARTAADAALGARIDAEHTLITQETADRIAAVQAEATARANADAAIGLRLLGKNRIINGNFDIYQRGNPGTITNTAAYTADRWICSSAGAGATSNWGLGATTPGEIPDSVRFLGFNVVAGVSSAWVGQWIEGVHTFAGGKATVSFWMRSGVAGKKVGLLIQQHFGIGGSTMVEVQASSVITLTTNFTKYTVTFDVPSIAGKSVGGNNALLLTFFYADDRSTMFGGQLIGQTGLFELAQVQMERGDKATDFDWRPVGDELLLCQRYFSKSYAFATKPGTGNADPGRISTGIQISGANSPSFTAHPVRFPVTMRVAPAVTVYGAVSGNPNKVTMSDNADCTGTATVRGIAEGGCEVNWTNNAGTFGGWFHYAANSEF
ncbi:hypothetical protein [Stenotrophomonas indicatrix]|uniref:hypothetical protein n=1 Tax=Stenotrophomonas indicatrix TaxID=2045451 RepID=UPI00289C1FEA|nr:hypothetical protein [Stenotrophomonas indicatrix]